MFEPQKKLTTRQQTDEQHQAVQKQEAAATEFATAEDMLRHDALHTPVPPSIARRLQASLDQSPPAAPGWWRRFFGRKGEKE